LIVKCELNSETSCYLVLKVTWSSLGVAIGVLIEDPKYCQKFAASEV